MPASSNKGGQAMAFPDVCMTAAAPSPIPIPYPNICMFTGAKGSTCPDKVKFDNKKPVCQGTVISSSSGDEAGSSPGGCVCGQNKKEGEVKLGSGCVSAQGKKVAYIGVMVSHNKNNMPAGAQIAPSQTAITVVP